MRHIPTFALTALTACASLAQIAAVDEATCQSYGAPPGTDRYTACRMMQQELRMQENAARRAAFIQAAANARSRRGDDLSCTSQRTGFGVTQTDCRSR